MSGNSSSLNPQVGASASDVWQQFFREALRKRGAKKAAASLPDLPDEEEIVPAAEMRSSSIAGDPSAAAAAENSPDSAVRSRLDEGALDDDSPRPRLSLSPLEVVALALFGASVFCFVSLLLYNPGDYFNAEILRTRAEVSFGVGKSIFRPFGLAVYSLLGFTLFWSGAVFFRQGVRGVVLKGFGTMVFTTALAGLLGLAFPGEDGAGTLVHGGVVGEFLARRMTGSFDTLGATALLVLVGLISLIFATDWFFTSLARDGGPAVVEDDQTDSDRDEARYDDARDEAIPVVGSVEAAPEAGVSRDEDEDDAPEGNERAAAPPDVRPAVPAKRHPEPVPIETESVEAAPAFERPSPDEAEAARILARAVRASSSPSERREPAPPDFVPIEAQNARLESEPETIADLEPPRRTATARPRLRWRRRDDVTSDTPEPAFGAGLTDDEPRAEAPADAVGTPVSIAEPSPRAEEEPERELSIEAKLATPEPPAPIGLDDPESEDEAPSVVTVSEPEPVAARTDSPSSPSVRKAQLSLFDEVIDEISMAGRESRSSAPRRPSSPIPSVPAPKAPASIDDATYDDAVRIVLEAGRGSVSLLQRRLDVGYVTANRLLELMERDGVVGEHRGSGPREVRTTIDEWMRRNSSGRMPS